MDKGRVEQLHREATARWPAVAFSLDRFAAHLGELEPPHPIDTFLAGAAGHRLDPAWQVIQSDIAPPAMRILAKQPLADYSTDDLWADTVLKLIEDYQDGPALPDGHRPARIIRYRGLVALMSYCVVVARRLAIERKRRMRETPESSLTAADDGSQSNRNIFDRDASEATPEIETRETADAMSKAIAQAYQRLSSEQKFLITMVYREGLFQKRAGLLLGWSEFKTSREMTKAVESLRKAMSGVTSVQWSSELKNAWDECWSRCWKAPVEIEPKAAEASLNYAADS